MSFDFGERRDADPTTDFLARERAAAGALTGDADLFGGASGAAGDSLSALGQHAAGGDRDFESSAANFPALDGENGQRAAAAFDDDDLLGGGGAASFQTSAPAAPAVENERDQFERNFPELEDEIPPPMPVAGAPAAQPNGFMAAAPVPSYAQPIPSDPAASADPYGQREANGQEPEAVRRWRQEQEKDIARREATAERKKGETISKAEQDIDNFYAEYNRKKEKAIAKNKEAEAAFKAQRQAELAEGTTWSRVTKLVDLQNSQSKTIARSGPGATDLTRMKEILLSLRREGETAPGASGY